MGLRHVLKAFLIKKTISELNFYYLPPLLTKRREAVVNPPADGHLRFLFVNSDRKKEKSERGYTVQYMVVCGLHASAG